MLNAILQKIKVPQKTINSLLNNYCLTENELNAYLAIILFSLPVFFYFVLKSFQIIMPLTLINILGLYTVGCAIYEFVTCSKLLAEKLSISVGLTLSYVFFQGISRIPLNIAGSIAIYILVVYVLTIYLVIHNRYYNATTYKDNPAGLVMFGKKFAMMKFESEFVASCIKIKDNATRNSVKRDISDLYNRIKREMTATNANKSIAEYSEEKIKGGKGVTQEAKPLGAFNKGVVTIPGGIDLPIFEFNGGVPVVYIRGLDNHITKTLDFARKSKVGTDINGQNYIYPITPYLNRYEIELFTDADNIAIAFKEEKIKMLSKEKILKSISILDKVTDCYNDFFQKIKDTLDSITSDRIETEMEMEVKHDTEQLTSILNIYKLEASRRENEGPADYERRENYRSDSRQNRPGQERRPGEQGREGRTREIPEPMVKSRQEIFAEGMDELENLIGLNGIKNEIKQRVDKYRLDKYASQIGLPAAQISNNFVFIGNPGVGKTTVARILAKLLYGLEMLRSYEICEVNKSDLIGKYVGETEEKTKSLLDQVIQKGCLLLIEEFHQLYNPKNDKDYGREAIKVLMPALEKHKDKFACVVTGYGDMISTTIKNADPGLESRFSSYLYFENFKPEELVKIFEIGFCGQRYNLNHDSRQSLRRGLTHLTDAYTDFCNARDARKIFEKAVKKQTNRLAGQQGNLSKDRLMLINKEDIESAIQEYISEKNRMEEHGELNLMSGN